MLFVFYVARSLLQRARANAITLITVALFVAGATLGLSYYANLKSSLVSTAPPDTILVLSEGAPTEIGSRLELDTARRLVLLDGIKRDGQVPLAARELLSNVSLEADDVVRYTPPVPFRGIDEHSIAVHQAEFLEGSPPAPGSLEVSLGRKLAAAYPNLEVGSQIPLPAGTARVSGIFAARGGPLEAEVWTPRAALEMHIGSEYSSSVSLVADDPARVSELVERINTSRDLNAQAAPLAAYMEDNAGLRTVALTVLILLAFLSVVAIFAIASTMHASIVLRLPEFASMAALGIRRTVLGRLVIMESVALATAGALLGVLVSELIRTQLGEISIGASPVQLSLNPGVAAMGIALGLLVGVVGGTTPAFKVARLRLIDLLR